jgi:hypothetical protein
MIDGEVVMVPPAVETASLGKCCWCNGSFHGNGDWRAVSMMTKLDDDEWDWLSGEYIHGECDYDRDAATKKVVASDHS